MGKSIKKRRIRDRTPLGGSISRQDIEIPDILEEEDMVCVGDYLVGCAMILFDV